MDVVEFVEARGGFATVHQLRLKGLPDHLLGELVSDGILRRPRRGWYTTRPANDPAVIAVSVGGRLTGVSALADMNAWLPDGPALVHVAVCPRSRRRRAPGVVIHWSDDPRAGTAWRVGISDALVRAALDEDLETAVSVFDWALSTGRLDRFEFEVVLNRLPARMQVLRHWTDERSQSVLESVARVRCLRRGWRVRSQVRVGDLQRIDLVIEDTVALELDGRKFHESTFSVDRRKDLAITAEGRHAIRIDKPILFGCWPDVERAIESALRARSRLSNVGTLLPIPAGRGVRPRPRGKSSDIVDAAASASSARSGIPATHPG